MPLQLGLGHSDYGLGWPRASEALAVMHLYVYANLSGAVGKILPVGTGHPTMLLIKLLTILFVLKTYCSFVYDL